MARLAARLRIDALRRMTESRGGHASLLALGDDHSGAVLVVICERGTPIALLESFIDLEGRQCWRQLAVPGPVSGNVNCVTDSGPDSDGPVMALIARRRQTDPDLWVVELDIANGQRFADEMIRVD